MRSRDDEIVQLHSQLNKLQESIAETASRSEESHQEELQRIDNRVRHVVNSKDQTIATLRKQLKKLVDENSQTEKMLLDLNSKL